MVLMVSCCKDKVDMHQCRTGLPSNLLSFAEDCSTKSLFCNLKIRIVARNLFCNSKLIFEICLWVLQPNG